jgi:hypothetical protein
MFKIATHILRRLSSRFFIAIANNGTSAAHKNPHPKRMRVDKKKRGIDHKNRELMTYIDISRCFMDQIHKNCECMKQEKLLK